MPATAMGLALCLVGAVFVYRSLRSMNGAREASAGPENGPGEGSEAAQWLPDQDPNRLVEWLKVRSKVQLGFLLLAIGFALQLLGVFVPGSRIVG